jgi:hypothetical protein
MKNLIIIFSLGFLLVACSNKNDQIEKANEALEIGNTELIPDLSIAEFNEKAGDFVNTEVRVKGIVDHVCKHGGKKILLVNDDGDIHITSDERFPEELVGEEIYINGIVEEFRVDEGYCIQMDEDNIKSHKEGATDSELFESKKMSIQAYRDSMKVAGVDHLSYYSMVFVSYEVIGTDDNEEIMIEN